MQKNTDTEKAVWTKDQKLELFNGELLTKMENVETVDRVFQRE